MLDYSSCSAGLLKLSLHFFAKLLHQTGKLLLHLGKLGMTKTQLRPGYQVQTRQQGLFKSELLAQYPLHIVAVHRTLGDFLAYHQAQPGVSKISVLVVQDQIAS